MLVDALFCDRSVLIMPLFVSLGILFLIELDVLVEFELLLLLLLLQLDTFWLVKSKLLVDWFSLITFEFERLVDEHDEADDVEDDDDDEHVVGLADVAADTCDKLFLKKK